MSGGILFKILVLGINEMVFNLSSKVLKGYSLFLIYKTNIFVKLLKLHLMPIWFYFFFFLFIFMIFELFLLVVSIFVDYFVEIGICCVSSLRPDPARKLSAKPVWHIPLLCVQWKTPDDGQRNFPTHVEFYYKNKFEKLVHLFGFIVRIYNDARSPERHIQGEY